MMEEREASIQAIKTILTCVGLILVLFTVYMLWNLADVAR